MIPCHNYGRFLREAWESVAAQSRRPDEVVIVNDGSTDETAAVAAGILAEDPSVRVITRHPARGAVASFNDGIRATTTDYVMLLSADDRISPDYLEQSAAVLDAGYDVAQSDVMLFGEESGTILSPTWSLRSLLVANHQHGSMLYRRSLFDALGGYGPFRREDWALWIAAAATGATAARTRSCQLEYRKHGPSRSAMSVGDGRRDRLEIFRAYRREIGTRRLVRAVIDLTVGKLRR